MRRRPRVSAGLARRRSESVKASITSGASKTRLRLPSVACDGTLASAGRAIPQKLHVRPSSAAW